MVGNLIYSNPFLVLSILGLILVILIIWVVKLEFQIKRLMRGKKGVDLENVLIDAFKNIEQLNISFEENSKDLERIKEKMRKNVQTVGTVRFNPFKDSGSNQSFASAFLDEDGNGVVISTLYSRERVGIYGKPVKNFKSEYELSSEEKEAIDKSASGQT